MKHVERCRKAFTSPDYLIKCWAEDGLINGDTSLLGRKTLLILGGGFSLVPKVLGDIVEDVSGSLHTIRVWRLKEADASIIALAGGSAYVEAVMAMLCLSSVEKIYAMGWCGSLDEEIRPGDILIAYAAVRGDGTTCRYVDPEYPAVADPVHVIDLYHKLRTYGLRPKLSIIYTTSTHLREKEILEKWKGKAQCSVLYIISRLLGIPSVAALVVSDTLVHKYRDVYSTVNVAEKLLKILVEIMKEH